MINFLMKWINFDGKFDRAFEKYVIMPLLFLDGIFGIVHFDDWEMKVCGSFFIVMSLAILLVLIVEYLRRKKNAK